MSSLSLHGTWVDDQYVDSVLRAFTSLEAAHLYGTSVGDGIVPAIVEHPRLKYINVTDTKVTEDAVAEIAKNRPKMRIHAGVRHQHH